MSRRRKIRLGVLGSTRGSALRPIMAAAERGDLAVEPVAVVSNRRKAPIVDYARETGLAATHVSAKDRERAEFDALVTAELEKHGVELVLMIGYMRIVSPEFVERWRGRLLNIHPSLLPRHGGLMDLEVHRSVLAAGDSETGCTLHLAEEEVDAGRIVLQKRCRVRPDDSPEILKDRVQALEAEAFLDLLRDPGRYLETFQEPLVLRVEGLSAGFETGEGFLEAVDRVSFTLGPRESLGIVGESGCGKSVTALSLLRLLPQPAGRITGGRILLGEENLATAPEERLRAVRGREIGMVFQEPMTALNPVQTIGRQIGEVLLTHGMADAGEARRQTLDILRRVGIPAPEQRMAEYPHQLSGGMRQRVVIAIALVCRPRILIADEPTTALDVTTQAQILELLGELRESLHMSLILITHDLGVIAETCDRVVVMYAGRVVESAPVRELFANPLHRYTAGLLRSIPSLDTTPKTPLPTIPGRVPSLGDLPVGARFAPRSDHPDAAAYLESEDFRSSRPALVEARPGHWVEDCDVVRTDR